CWGWGWIGWSDCYRFAPTPGRDLRRSEQLLREGLSMVEVRDRPDLAERLADLYDEQGRGEEAQEFRRQAKRSAPAIETRLDVEPGGRVLREKATITFGDEGLRIGCRRCLTILSHQRELNLRKTPSRQGENHGVLHARQRPGRTNHECARKAVAGG